MLYVKFALAESLPARIFVRDVWAAQVQWSCGLGWVGWL